MNRIASFRRALCAGFLCIMTGFTTQVGAQTSAQLSADSVVVGARVAKSAVPVVTVSAERRLERLQDVPASVSALNAETIQSSGIQTLRNITARVPNLFMPDYGTRLTAPIFVRGVGSRINDPSVGLYVDGVNYFDRSAYDFELYDIESIEVLRGPQGTLFGRNAMGGIIHVVTQKPSAKALLAGSASYGAFNDQQYRLSLQAPIVGHELFGRISFARNSRNGFTTNAFEGAEQAQTGIDFRDGWSGRAQLRWLPNEQWDAQLTLYGSRDRDGGTPYAPITRAQEKPYTANFNGESAFDRDMLGATLRATLDLQHFRITSATSWQTLANRFAIDQDFDPRDILNVETRENQALITQEITASSYYKNSPVQWILGAFGFWQSNSRGIDLRYGRDAVGFVPGIASPRGDFRTNDAAARGYAFFGQFTANDLFIKGLSATLGLRYDAEFNALATTRRVQIPNAAQPASPTIQNFTPFQEELSFSELLPKFVIKYAATDDATAYISVSKGYKGGGFNTSALEEEDRRFGAEQSWNYEIGAKLSWWERRLTANVSAFWIDWTNQQIYQLVPQSGSILRNAGRTVSRGAELDLTIRPIPQIMIVGALGYTDARFTQYADQQTTRNSAGQTVTRTIDYAGNRIPFVPEFTANLAAEYSLDLEHIAPFARSLDIRLEGQAIGETFWREDNTLRQAAYMLLNARVTFRSQWGALALWAHNIADERYTSIQFFSLPNLPLYAQLGAPRSFGVQYSFAFGN